MTHPYYFTWMKQEGVQPIPVQSARGSHYILEDGRHIVDMISTSFQASFGHSEERIYGPIAKQLRDMPMASPKMTFHLKTEQSKRLLQLLNFNSGKLFYTVSGAEAVENALKIARQTTGRKIILARHKSYHGASLGALSVTGDWRHHAHATLNEWTVRIPEPSEDPDLSFTEKIILQTGADKIAAICLETISGTNGVIIAPHTWWSGIQALCRKHDILLICDEVLVGFGRTGKPFAFQDYGLQPDMVCMAKGISGGYIPFGALWTSERIAQYYDREIFSCGLTNYAHPLGLAAMSGVLDLFSDARFLECMRRSEGEFTEGLARVATHEMVKEIRHKGHLAAIELHSSFTVKEFSSFLEHGLYVFASGSLVILAPPLNADPVVVRDAMTKVASVIAKLADQKGLSDGR